MKTVNYGTKQKTLQMTKKVSLKIIDLLSAPYPKKAKNHLNLKKMMDEAMSILRSKKNNVPDPDESFRMTIGASLQFISNIQNTEFAKVKIQEIIFQAQFGNPMAPFCTKSYDANTANHLSSWNSNSPQLTKKLRLICIFHLHRQIS